VLGERSANIVTLQPPAEIISSKTNAHSRDDKAMSPALFPANIVNQSNFFHAPPPSSSIQWSPTRAAARLRRAHKHAERLKLRLRLAMYKVDTKQQAVALNNLPLPVSVPLPPSSDDSSQSSRGTSTSLSTQKSNTPPSRSPVRDSGSAERRHGTLLSSAVKGSNHQFNAASELLNLYQIIHST